MDVLIRFRFFFFDECYVLLFPRERGGEGGEFWSENFNSRDKCRRIFAEIRGKGGAWNDGCEMSVGQRENMNAGNQNYINNAALSSLELTRPHLRLN